MIEQIKVPEKWKEFLNPSQIEAIETTEGPVKAIAFVADPEHDQFVDYDCATSAQMIAKAHGGRGPNIDYFNNTHDHLLELGIKDPLFESIAKYLE